MVRIISALVLAVSAAASFAQEPPQLADNPPDRHIVVPGDTLWGIAGKFLKEPWRWPEVWRLNKEDIKNPHRIYPGDIVVLDLSGGDPRLKIAKPLKLQPQVYSEQSRSAISSIPTNVIEPFISKPLIIEADGLAKAPRIVATQEDRVFLGNGDTGFVSGIVEADQINWQLYRPGKPLKDPDDGEILGYEAFYLGTAKLVKPGTDEEPATIRVVAPKEEVGRGDYLIPAPPTQLVAYAPHKPDQPVKARVMSIYGGLDVGGPQSVITLNRGNKDGIERGHVVALYRKRVSKGYDDSNRRVETPIPDERYALAFVFRTYERISYALVMETTKPVLVGDAVRNP